MAKNKVCEPCSTGASRDCKGRWQAPSSRGESVGGDKPRQSIFTYKCPDNPVEIARREAKIARSVDDFNKQIKSKYPSG